MARTKVTDPSKRFNYVGAVFPKNFTCSPNLYYYVKKKTKQKYKNTKANKALGRVGHAVKRCVIKSVPITTRNVSFNDKDQIREAAIRADNESRKQ